MIDTNMINVLISDGNRTVNWDYFPDKKVKEIIEQNGFRPIPWTIKIGGQEPPRDMILLLSDCPQEVSPDGQQMRVRITFKSVPEKKLNLKRKGADDEDVR